jgi:hypothetical protein
MGVEEDVEAKHLEALLGVIREELMHLCGVDGDNKWMV